MHIQRTPLRAVKLIEHSFASDHRGSFTKTFNASSLKALGIDFTPQECFYSISKKNVIRGMHFHSPPHDHDKIVFCTEGRILDVALDIRPSETSYGKHVAYELSPESHKALFIPKGFSHGFLALSETATTFYLVNGEFHADADNGVHYNSFGFEWPVLSPILSDRDLALKSFKTLLSPYTGCAQ
ncbi:MAG: dTDP-4-dehydrorhamnose 3,5-epimerase family protein [Planctomycetota bacterium]